MTNSKPHVSYWLLLGDFVFYLALFVAAIVWRRDAYCLLGSAIAVPGFILWFLAKLQLGGSFTARPEARELVTHGLYSRVRHPIYFFSTVAMVGIGICLRSIYFWVFLGLAIAGQVWRIGLEEKVLQEKFGRTYLDYKARTWF